VTWCPDGKNRVGEREYGRRCWRPIRPRPGPRGGPIAAGVYVWEVFWAAPIPRGIQAPRKRPRGRRRRGVGGVQHGASQAMPEQVFNCSKVPSKSAACPATCGSLGSPSRQICRKSVKARACAEERGRPRCRRGAPDGRWAEPCRMQADRRRRAGFAALSNPRVRWLRSDRGDPVVGWVRRSTPPLGAACGRLGHGVTHRTSVKML